MVRYQKVSVKGRKVDEHIVIAERALGRPLPPGAVVHHVDGNKKNNAPSNLVLCPDGFYHHLLHIRARALDACGNVNWRQCRICHKWDDPEKLSRYDLKRGGTQFAHRECGSAYAREWRARE